MHQPLPQSPQDRTIGIRRIPDYRSPLQQEQHSPPILVLGRRRRHPIRHARGYAGERNESQPRDRRSRPRLCRKSSAGLVQRDLRLSSGGQRRPHQRHLHGEYHRPGGSQEPGPVTGYQTPGSAGRARSTPDLWFFGNPQLPPERRRRDRYRQRQFSQSAG